MNCSIKTFRSLFLIPVALAFFFLSTAGSTALVAQDLTTAARFFDTVSEKYGTIEDYEANIVITHGDTIMRGVIYYRTPNLVRINFIEPEDQVLAVDGENLTLFLPLQNVVMRQRLHKHSGTTLATMTSQQGLNILRRSYSVAFLDSPNPVPLDAESDEMVRKLKLVWRTTDEGFRQIDISINEEGMIRRMKGITADYETVQFDFINIRTNRNIPVTRFEYGGSPTAHTIENFLFEAED